MPLPRFQAIARTVVGVGLGTSALLHALAPLASAQSARWRVDEKPAIVIGAATPDDQTTLAIVTGATRLADGNIMVGDHNEQSMFVFAPNGKLIKSFARKGAGPGEVGYSAWMMRCGDKALVNDIQGDKISVFSLSGAFERAFRFSTKVGASQPYRSACNRNGAFVHYGWDLNKDMKVGVFRSMVPLWTSASDSSIGTMIATVAGSERWGTKGGTGPLPLGKETRIAIGNDRIYVGEAIDYSIRVFSLSGAVLPVIRKSAKAVAIKSSDVDASMEAEISSMGEKSRTRVVASYASMDLPKTFPPYQALVVDATQNLWVQDYAPSSPGKVLWTVFDVTGKQIAELVLPSSLDIYEIGNDYILGRYVDPDESVPQVRLYKLTRGAR